MKVTRLLIPLMLICALPSMAMTDQQIISYIQAQLATGKSQEEIGAELIAQGVTTEQIQRLKAQYESGQITMMGGTSNTGKKTDSRMRGEASSSTDSELGSETGMGMGMYGTGMMSGRSSLYSQSSLNARMNRNNRMLMQQMYANGNNYNSLYGLQNPYMFGGQLDDYLLLQNSLDGNGKNIYGHDIFFNNFLTFEPNANMATPQDYRLGPGDEVIIDIWGASEDNIRQKISPDGSIIVSQLGPIYLNGMTVAQANNHVKNIFSKKYAGIGTDTDVNLTLGNIRTIQVNVMGEVALPGTFRLSPFATVFNALYSAGGINDIGSLRNIEVLRNGKKISNVDIYDYIFRGKDTGNVRLQEGDVIIVPSYSQLVSVEGNVKRPMLYELKPNESLQKLIEYAGGFAGNAYTEVVRVERQNGVDNEMYTINQIDFPSYTLRDGDIVTVGQVTDKFTNKVELKGAVNRPGTYALNDDIKTLKSLINSAEGLAEDAFLNRALIYRETPDRSLEVIAVNIGRIMDGSIADITLNKNDIIEISNVNEITERGNITIQGLVAKPGEYMYAKGMTVEDLILQAGGLLEGASTSRVDVARRIVDQNATDATESIAQVFQFEIENGMTVGNGKGFTLMPYDVVQIRKSPTYTKQEFITVEGQVLFPGQYVLQSRNERISTIINRAGGLLKSAYVQGAYLKRNLTEEQKLANEETKRLANANNDSESSLNMDKIDLADQATVGIDLEKAIANPGSPYDFVLQEGDLLVVPELQSTVKIQGEVLFPNTVVYSPGKKLSYYIQQAGGYSQKAKKNKTYIVYMNGNATKAKGSTPIEPGCQIIVPTKPDGKEFDWNKVLTIATALGSMATMAATVVSLTK